MDAIFPSIESTGRMSFRAKNYFSHTVGNYRVFTADSRFEVFQALQLRGRVFLNAEQVDVDAFDLIADHILIEDVSKSQIIGTYRLISTVFSNQFYSQSEFNIDSFLKEPGGKVELGRACIHPNYRNGRSIDLLWRGISTYMRLLNAKFLFGCSSVFFVGDNYNANIQGLYANYSQNKYEVSPHVAYPDLENNIQIREFEIPSLLQSYLNAGAILCGKPYLDEEWNCVDFFTVLDIDRLSEKYKKHYFSKSLSYVENF